MAAVGDTVRATMNVSDNSGPLDATDVIIRFIRPDGTLLVEKTLTEGQILPVEGEPGAYTCSAKLDMHGRWRVRGRGIGPNDTEVNRMAEIYINPS